ncbi:hypothetical protein [Nocardia farcinica]|uniref:hypothetical protein n=1 Tax=Nocardia farcinica TaxID=37329 RepID=UPI002458EA5A|nr:hypothetical protein [Nocardia farcinica]
MTAPTVSRRSDELDRATTTVLNEQGEGSRLIGWAFDGHTLHTAFTISLDPDTPTDMWPTVIEHAATAALDQHHAHPTALPIVAYTLRLDSTISVPYSLVVTADAGGSVQMSWKDREGNIRPSLGSDLADLVQKLARTTGERYLTITAATVGAGQ